MPCRGTIRVGYELDPRFLTLDYGGKPDVSTNNQATSDERKHEKGHTHDRHASEHKTG